MTSEILCPAGHVMNPADEKCPRCGGTPALTDTAQPEEKPAEPVEDAELTPNPEEDDSEANVEGELTTDDVPGEPGEDSDSGTDSDEEK